MTRDEVKNGTRVIFGGPPTGRVVTFFDDENHKLADVFAAYGWPADLADDELLARLLKLNSERSQ